MSDIIVDYNPFHWPICNDCIFWKKELRCKAFDRIPDEIISGKNNHNKIIEGQKGEYVFTPKK
jgi:hypothetical protein